MLNNMYITQTTGSYEHRRREGLKYALALSVDDDDSEGMPYDYDYNLFMRTVCDTFKLYCTNDLSRCGAFTWVVCSNQLTSIPACRKNDRYFDYEHSEITHTLMRPLMLYSYYSIATLVYPQSPLPRKLRSHCCPHAILPRVFFDSAIEMLCDNFTTELLQSLIMI